MHTEFREFVENFHLQWILIFARLIWTCLWYFIVYFSVVLHYMWKSPSGSFLLSLLYFKNNHCHLFWNKHVKLIKVTEEVAVIASKVLHSGNDFRYK